MSHPLNDIVLEKWGETAAEKLTNRDIYDEAIRNIWKMYEPNLDRALTSLVTTGTTAHLHAPYEGLTVEKLRQAKRELMRTDVDQYRYIWPTPTFRMKKEDIDKQILDMLLKKGETSVTTKKTKVEKFNTIGVRFPENPGKEYTYKVRIGAKPYLGQELVADTPRGQAVVFVTRIDKTPQETLPENLFTPTLKYIERKAVAL